MKRQPITLSSRDQATIVRLLGILQTLTESEIEVHVIGGKFGGQPGIGMERIVADARRRWRQTEDVLIRFEGRTPARHGIFREAAKV